MPKMSIVSNFTSNSKCSFPWVNRLPKLHLNLTLDLRIGIQMYIQAALI